MQGITFKIAVLGVTGHTQSPCEEPVEETEAQDTIFMTRDSGNGEVS